MTEQNWMSRTGVTLNFIGLGAVLMGSLIRMPDPLIAMSVGIVAAVPYSVMLFIHFRLDKTKVQRAVALVGSLGVAAIGLWLTLDALFINRGEFSTGIGLVVMLTFQSVFAAIALLICAFIWRAGWHEQRQRSHEA